MEQKEQMMKENEPLCMIRVRVQLFRQIVKDEIYISIKYHTVMDQPTYFFKKKNVKTAQKFSLKLDSLLRFGFHCIQKRNYVSTKCLLWCCSSSERFISDNNYVFDIFHKMVKLLEPLLVDLFALLNDSIYTIMSPNRTQQEQE